MLSFVYDIADLYKTEITIPAAFHAAAEAPEGLETRVRKRCRDAFRESRILQRIIPDIERALGAAKFNPEPDFDADPAAPGWLWDYERGGVRGGVNRATDAESGTAPEGQLSHSDASDLPSGDRSQDSGDPPEPDDSSEKEDS